MRGLSKRFLGAMREGLENGRRKGYTGWDSHWQNAFFAGPPKEYLKSRLYREIEELVVALEFKNSNSILHEAADVANFAMMLADITKEEP